MSAERRHGRWAALPLVVVTALYAWVGAWWIALVVLATIAPSFFVARRIDASANAQRIGFVACVATGIALGLLHTPTLGFGAGTLPSSASAAVVALLFAAAPRVYMRRAGLGHSATIALATLALVACGATRSGFVYGTAAIAFVAAALFAMRDHDVESRARWREMAWRERAAALLLVAGAAMAATTVARVLPRLQELAESRFVAAYDARMIGFSQQLRLGSMQKMLRSDEIVLRLTGPHADYLRGVVYEQYRASPGQWIGDSDAEPRPVTSPHAPPTSGDVVTVTRVAGFRNRYFVPLAARAFGTRSGRANVDSRGIVVVASETLADDYWYEIGERDDLAIAAPRPVDLDVPRTLRAPLAKLAAEWTLGLASDREKVQRIAEKLATEYTYSLEFDRSGDPLLHFLFIDKRGHCEYFASALALLARAAGIPARMVAGYRVAERVPLTSHYVVREKNAHAWVEAWTAGADGGAASWRTIDATPYSEVVQNLPHTTSLGATLTDYAQSTWTFVISLTLRQILLALAVLVPSFFVVRFLSRRRRRSARTDGSLGAAEGPLECLATLQSALAKRGVLRARSEPLSRFASRVSSAGFARAAALVDEYAALRYGGDGDAATIARAMQGCAKDLRRRS